MSLTSIKVQGCIVAYSRDLGEPSITTVANASWVRWGRKVEILIMDDGIEFPPKYRKNLKGCFFIIRESDSRLLAFSTVSRNAKEPVPG